MKRILLTGIAMFIFGLAPGYVAADEYGQGNAQSWGDNTTENMPMGKHSMGATIESIDYKTGFMKLKSGLGEMTIHFPAPTIKDLKKGDRINISLSFTKVDEKMNKDGMMKMK